ncbi:MAG: nicotinate (nicotinamide) nucleotide adenylyltransferase [Clostridia bacterium]|nr:nicotinate (nicotinamide) nucleotide adenylyltransferase [Clostridia bacterium]
MANIAIFGGTFNPFHIGHYEMLSSICKLEYIDKVFLMPDKIPPHKTCDFLASDTDRINMCDLIAKEFKKVELCLIEFEREGKSYTVDTVKLLKQKYPDDNFYIVIGGDMLTSFDTWYNWQELLTLVGVIAFKRDGIVNFDEAYDKLTKSGGNITIINNEITDISSTKLRQKVDKSLLPTSIYNYIIEKGIYNV